MRWRFASAGTETPMAEGPGPTPAKRGRNRAAKQMAADLLFIERFVSFRLQEPRAVAPPTSIKSENEICEKQEDGLRDRASLPRRYEGAIREVNRGAASQQGQPAERPDLPRGRRVGWRLDDHRSSRLKGELGAVPRRRPDAAIQAGHQRRVQNATAGDGHYCPQPAVVAACLGSSRLVRSLADKAVGRTGIAIAFCELRVDRIM